jgi:hypothetical protein
METRLSGRDISLDPQPDEEGDAVTPIAYLTDAENEPVQLLERAETERNQTEGACAARSRNSTTAAGASSRPAGSSKTTPRRCRSSPTIWRVGRAHPADRGQGTEGDAEPDGQLRAN